MAQPIGFAASWRYLEGKLQARWRDSEFLMPALELLVATRAARIRLDEEYSVLRRIEKQAGRRFPPRTHVTPTDPARWHGDEQVGAVHALTDWRQRPFHAGIADHPLGNYVLAIVGDVLAVPLGGETNLDLDELQHLLDWARRQIFVAGWEADNSEYSVAWSAYRLLGQVHLLLNGATSIGMPWNFRTT